MSEEKNKNMVRHTECQFSLPSIHDRAVSNNATDEMRANKWRQHDATTAPPGCPGFGKREGMVYCQEEVDNEQYNASGKAGYTKSVRY
ncbi:hypothetical protein T05_13665 [Trichinella murrelli]|uniref:Uncharacterized protein n=3 Tax=Trichinella TaxID=6333 RepID=A0A0V0UJG1_9BILA|nr:hypothetical protein T05_13665 [Trichinella murrelli]